MGPRGWGLALALVAAATTGCASNYAALANDVAAMRSELKKLRTANVTLQDRVDALEEAAERAPAPSSAAEAGATAPPDDRPRLRVVRLSPQSTEEAAPAPAATPPPDDGPRPVIRGDGRQVEITTSAEAKDAKPKVKRGRGPQG